MAYILNIETATTNCSVAIAEDGILIALREFADQGYSHAEKLHIFIEQALAEAKLEFKDLSAVAVSQGPGSYTGLRIGVSSAKGLCFALDIPLLAIDTLIVLAGQANVRDGFVIPMLDARRMEVYSAVFNSKMEQIRAVEAEILDQSSFADLDGKVYFVSNCTAKCKTVLTKDNFIFLDDIVNPSAKEMCVLSFEKFKKNDFADLAYFEPLYVKDFMITVKK